MFALDYLLALSLFSAPNVPLEADVVLCPLSALWTMAESLELVDARERPYLFSDRSSALEDVRIVRARYCDLFDAPPVFDALRFPTHDFCRDMCNYNRVTLRWWEGANRLHHWGWFDDMRCEFEQLYGVWDAASDAGCEYYYVSTRRLSLKKLRELLGPEQYYAGLMPQVVPVWRYRRPE